MKFQPDNEIVARLRANGANIKFYTVVYNAPDSPLGAAIGSSVARFYYSVKPSKIVDGEYLFGDYVYVDESVRGVPFFTSYCLPL